MRTEPSRRGRHAGRVHRDPGHSHPGIRSVRDRAHRVTPDPQRAGGVPGDRAISGAVFSGTSSPARRPPRPPGAAEHSLRLRRCPDPRNVLPYSSPGRSRCAGRCDGPGAVAPPRQAAPRPAATARCFGSRRIRPALVSEDAATPPLPRGPTGRAACPPAGRAGSEPARGPDGGPDPCSAGLPSTRSPGVQAVYPGFVPVPGRACLLRSVRGDVGGPGACGRTLKTSTRLREAFPRPAPLAEGGPS